MCFGRGKTKKKQQKAFERGYNAGREEMKTELDSELATVFIRLCCSTKAIMLHYSVYAYNRVLTSVSRCTPFLIMRAGRNCRRPLSQWPQLGAATAVITRHHVAHGHRTMEHRPASLAMNAIHLDHEGRQELSTSNEPVASCGQQDLRLPNDEEMCDFVDKLPEFFLWSQVENEHYSILPHD